MSKMVAEDQQRLLIDDDSVAVDPRPRRRSLILLRNAIGIVLFLFAAVAFISFSSLMKIPELNALSRIAALPHAAKLDPNHVDHRLVLLGDVHGMYDELQQLLDDIDFDRKTDTLVFLGDMVTKGPDSLKVVDFAIDVGAYCVRGNHEDDVLAIYADIHHLEEPRTYPPHASARTMIAGDKPSATLSATIGTRPIKNKGITAADEISISEPTDAPSLKKNEIRDKALAKRLKKRHVRYLQSCPAVLQLGQVSKRGIEAVAVHGGLVATKTELELQNIEDVLRIRAIVPPDYTHGSEDPDDGPPWFNLWNEVQRDLPKHERFEVFYGHDASKGLQLHRYSKGLDTRCSRGGKLSAYVVRVEKDGHFHEDLHQIDC